MKKYKYCNSCLTNQNIENKVCANCGADLEDKIYTQYIILPIVLTVIVFILAFFVNNYFFMKYNETYFSFDIIFGIIFILFLYNYFTNVLNKLKLGLFWIFLGFLKAIFKIKWENILI